jgi:hypothetical protein
MNKKKEKKIHDHSITDTIDKTTIIFSQEHGPRIKIVLARFTC